MMPLSMAKLGEANSIKKIGGNAEIRLHLENLGFVPGSKVSLITRTGENVIVQVKESRVALSREMAQKIMI
ncbi:MAG: ferrous iron transport protein A [Oscillospiraceae bacterium]|jgi:ferrous iron transport protein A|nr:ferrous iron transport protein A [Oscillospiraceae bacterium]